MVKNGELIVGRPKFFVNRSMDDFSLAAVPEPGTLLLFGSGVLGMASYGVRKLRKHISF